MTTSARAAWSHDPVVGSALRRSIQVTPAVVELVMIDRAVACGRLVTAAAASFAAPPAAPWARFTVLAAVVLLAAGGLITLARPLADPRARSRRFAARVPVATTTRGALGIDLVAALALVVALGPGSGQVPTTAVLAFCLLPLLEGAIRFGLGGLTAVWLAVVGSLAVAAGIAIVGGSRTTVVDALAPLGVLGILAVPVGLLVLALGAAITRFELASDAARTRSRLLSELTRLSHDLAATRRNGGGDGDGDGMSAGAATPLVPLLVRSLGRLGFDGVTVVEVAEAGLTAEGLGRDEVPRIFAAEELLALGGPVAPPTLAGQPVTCGFAAVSRIDGDGPAIAVVGWSVADPLLAARLEAFAAAVAAFRSAALSFRGVPAATAGAGR